MEGSSEKKLQAPDSCRLGELDEEEVTLTAWIGYF